MIDSNRNISPSQTTPEKISVNPFTLSFSGNYCFLEPRFIEDEFSYSPLFIRTASALMALILVLQTILEYKWLPSDALPPFLSLHVFAFSLIAAVFVVSFYHPYFRLVQPMASLIALICGAGLIVLMSMNLPDIRSSCYLGLALILIVIFLVVRVRFLYSTLTGLVLLALYTLMSVLFLSFSTPQMVLNLIFLIVTCLTCMWVAYFQEYSARRRFFVNHQLDMEKVKVSQALLELETRVKDRNQELSSTNTRLLIEIAEREQTQKEYVHLATHDALTNLPNRALMRDRLRHALGRARRNDQLLAVLFLDLDGFKAVNDAYSHNCGDMLLKQVAERLTACLRENDTVCRFGGDEFVILIEGVHQASDATEVAKKILSTIEQPFTLDVAEVFISTSVGIAVFPDHGDNADTLLKNADIAMYRAKTLGKNGFQYFSDSIAEKASTRAALGAQMRRALSVKEFCLLYQPQIDLDTGKIVGVEALIRWRHPTEGLLPPSRFIPIAEENGLIVPIGEWALRTACNQINAWRTEGLPPVRVAVNISGRQLKEADFVDRIARILNETHVPPEQLELELTESVVFQYTGDNQTLLQRLKRYGVMLAVDDFGQGYSTLSHLARLPFDTLKMDKAFADNISGGTNDSVVAAGIITIARRLGLTVVAEGVETQEQLMFYELQGCNHVQGWLFSRAVEPGRISEMLKKGLVDRTPLLTGDNHNELA